MPRSPLALALALGLFALALVTLRWPTAAAAGRDPADAGRLAELKSRLTPEQFRVTQEGATERPFRNAYHAHHAAGLYVDVVSGEPLFTSREKYDSGTGWPSFFAAAPGVQLVERPDVGLLGHARIELRSPRGDSHLGHVFEDGPPPTHRRYCINSAALRFVPRAELLAQGYDAALLAHLDARAAPKEVPPIPKAADPSSGSSSSSSMGASSSSSAGGGGSSGVRYPDVDPRGPRETLTVAGGCFWGVQELFKKIPGVVASEVGYTGGTSTKDVTYDTMKKGGHAEAVQVVFDPSKVSYEDLLLHFFKLHDPTTKNRQGNDVGPQYRSAVFYADEAQKQRAAAVLARVNASGVWKGRVVTELVPARAWFRAEPEHQDYLERNPGGYTCHYLRDLKLDPEL